MKTQGFGSLHAVSNDSMYICPKCKSPEVVISSSIQEVWDINVNVRKTKEISLHSFADKMTL